MLNVQMLSQSIIEIDLQKPNVGKYSRQPGDMLPRGSGCVCGLIFCSSNHQDSATPPKHRRK